MMLVGLLMGLIVSFLLGGIIVYYLGRENGLNALEKLSLSFLLGNGAISLILFWLSFFYLPYKILALSLIIIGLFLFVMKKRIIPDLSDLAGKIKMGVGTIAKMDAKKIFWVVILAVIALKMSYSFIETASKPEYSWDACAHWTYPGKVIYDLAQRGMSDIPTTLTRFPGHISHYPKLIPYMHYWLFSWMGQANDQWSKIFLPISLVCFVMIFYSSLRKYKSALETIFYVWLLLSAPLFLYHSTFGYADFTSSLFFSTGIIMFYRWLREKQEAYFYLFSIFIALTTWIKSEGLPLYLIGFTLLVVFLWSDYERSIRKKAIKVAQYLGAYIGIGLPWQLYLTVNQIRSTWNFEPHYDGFLNVISYIYSNLFFDGSWGLMWFAVVASCVLFYKSLLKKENRCLFLALMIFNGLFLFTYLSFDMYAMANAAINRNWLNIYPVAIFTMGCVVPRFAELLPDRGEDAKG
jgi:hypothetical protein